MLRCWLFDRGEKKEPCPTIIHTRILHRNDSVGYTALTWRAALKFMRFFVTGVLWRVSHGPHHDINPRSNDFYGPFVWETRQRLSTMGTSSEGIFVGDCSLFALFFLCHKRFHCFSLSLFFRKKRSIVTFFYFFFTQRVAQEQRPHCQQQHQTYILCMSYARKRTQLNHHGKRRFICNISNWRAIVSNTKGILSCPCMSIYQRNV